MDFLTLAMNVMHALAPLAPFLLGIGGGIGTGIVGKIGENIGDDVYSEGKQLYQIVEERFDKEKAIDHGSANRSLQNFLEEPETYQEIFKQKLLPLLQDDPNFADRLTRALDASPALQQIIRGGYGAILRQNEQSNNLGVGTQINEVGDYGLSEGNKQSIDVHNQNRR